MGMSFIIGRLETGSFTPLGKVDFDADHSPTLSFENGAHQESLQTAFDETIALDVLHIKVSVPEKNDAGGFISKRIGLEAEKGSDKYPHAMMHYMSDNYGFVSRPAH